MTHQRRGLALAGGGPLGGIYEVGALVALDEALDNARLADCDVYVGVSSGSFFAAGLANGMSPRDMFESFIANSTSDPFSPAVLMQPAVTEFARRLVNLMPLAMSIAGEWFGRPRLSARGLFDAAERFGEALPTGVFDNRGLIRYLARLFDAPGRTDDFRLLKKRLFVVATDLDSGHAVPFGAQGWDDVPISVAMAASAALPGLYPPVAHNGRFYVDGALKKTLHASVALREGVKLLLCINPLVPFDAALATRRTGKRPPPLVDGGLPLVLSQTFRSIIYSRMQAAMGRYALEYPDADIVLFEPRQDDPEMFFVNVFSYADRRRLCEHAYQQTRQELLRRHDALAPVFARHGITINRAVLEDATRTLMEPEPTPGLTGTLNRLDSILNRLAGALTRPEGRQHTDGDKDVPAVHA